MALPDYMGLTCYDSEIEDLAPDSQSPDRDLRPEHVQYRDEGCHLAPRCLSCPLPRCRHDDPDWLGRRARKERDRDIVEAWREERLTPKTLAARFGVTRRTVYRVLKEAREPYSTADFSKDPE